MLPISSGWWCMSVRLSGILTLSNITQIISPYIVEGTFFDSRGLFDSTLISTGNVIIDANKNRYVVTNVIDLSPLTLEVVWDDLGAPAQPTIGIGILGEVSSNRYLLEVTPDAPTGIGQAANNIDLFKNLDALLSTVTGPAGKG